MVEEIVNANMEHCRRVAENGHVMPEHVSPEFFSLALTAIDEVTAHYNGHLIPSALIRGHIALSPRFLEHYQNSIPVPLYAITAAGAVIKHWRALEAGKTRRSAVDITLPEALEPECL